MEKDVPNLPKSHNLYLLGRDVLTIRKARRIKNQKNKIKIITFLKARYSGRRENRKNPQIFFFPFTLRIYL